MLSILDLTRFLHIGHVLTMLDNALGRTSPCSLLIFIAVFLSRTWPVILAPLRTIV